MNQGLRLVTKPGTFFNQLQWSSRHWLIFGAFLGLSFVETQLGSGQTLNIQFARLLEARTGLGLAAALWFLTAARLVLMVVGAYVMSNVIWFIGNLFGKRTSKRVLFRRLSVVFTVFLAGFTLTHFENAYPGISVVGAVLCIWGLVLGYFAIREQFALTYGEAAIIGLFTVFMVMSTWHFSNELLESTIRLQIEQIASRPGHTVTQPR